MSPKDEKLHLFRGFPDRGTYVWSPYVIKLEFRLRHGNIPYDYEEGSTRNGPKGKVPYVDVSGLVGSDTPVWLGDSALITKWLIAHEKVPDLNADLDERDQLTDLCIRALLEEKLSFYNTCERWLDPQNYYIQRDKILGSKPWIMKAILGNIIYRSLTKTVYAQGAGRHSPEEQMEIRHEIWRGFGDLLEVRRQQATKSRSRKNEPFWVLGGKEPTEADATLFGFICSALMCQSCPESQAFVKSMPALTDYANRIHNNLFPDYEKWKE